MTPSWILSWSEVSEPLFQALAWTLVHFFWQGALIALLVRGALGLGRKADVRWRYGVACAGLVVMALAPCLTFYQLVQTPELTTVARTETPAASPAAGIVVPSAVEPATREITAAVGETPAAAPWQATWQDSPAWQRAKILVEPALPWISLAWLLGVTLLTAVHVGGLWRIRRLRSVGVEALDGATLNTARSLMKRLQIRRPVRFLQSAVAQVPMVVGWLRPALLVPVAALHGLPPAQLEAILAHELAHIRRRDGLVNLLQVVVETLLFYHPAVWWLSDQVRELREHCCDDLAAEACGDGLVVARALTELEALRPAPGIPSFALGATGGSWPDGFDAYWANPAPGMADARWRGRWLRSSSPWRPRRWWWPKPDRPLRARRWPRRHPRSRPPRSCRHRPHPPRCRRRWSALSCPGAPVFRHRRCSRGLLGFPSLRHHDRSRHLPSCRTRPDRSRRPLGSLFPVRPPRPVPHGSRVKTVEPPPPPRGYSPLRRGSPVVGFRRGACWPQLPYRPRTVLAGSDSAAPAKPPTESKAPSASRPAVAVDIS